MSYRYCSDFVVRLTDGRMILLEGMGYPDEKDDAKAAAARRCPEGEHLGRPWILEVRDLLWRVVSSEQLIDASAT